MRAVVNIDSNRWRMRVFWPGSSMRALVVRRCAPKRPLTAEIAKQLAESAEKTEYYSAID
jgi:hypothetical protein